MIQWLRDCRQEKTEHIDRHPEGEGEGGRERERGREGERERERRERETDKTSESIDRVCILYLREIYIYIDYLPCVW